MFLSGSASLDRYVGNCYKVWHEPEVEAHTEISQALIETAYVCQRSFRTVSFVNHIHMH